MENFYIYMLSHLCHVQCVLNGGNQGDLLSTVSHKTSQYPLGLVLFLPPITSKKDTDPVQNDLNFHVKKKIAIATKLITWRIILRYFCLIPQRRVTSIHYI